MKSSKSNTLRKTHAIPELRFEDQKLTSFSGLVVFQSLFNKLSLKKSLRACFQHRKVCAIFGDATVVLLLIVHLLLGYRELRHIRYYQNDPMVKRLLGLKVLPDVSTISRCLSSMDTQSTDSLQTLLRDGVLTRLQKLSLSRITLDFDGSVLSTGRSAEGTAVGFNKAKKGQRSYYPLICSVAQTGQVLGILHRSGNVHDSNGAKAFIVEQINYLRIAVPKVTIEVRMDSAFFSDSLIKTLESLDVEYTISVPFARFVEFKASIEARRKWHPMDKEGDYFEVYWKPKSWKNKRRFIAVRQKTTLQHKQPLQLDLFMPKDYQWKYKVVLTNKSVSARKAVRYHNGRGSQENIFGELKSGNALAYIPTKTWEGNKVYLISAMMAHNLSRELQMTASPQMRSTQEKRPSLWSFDKLSTLRRNIIQRAGRIIRPNGKLVLSMVANDAVKEEVLHYLEKVSAAS